MTIFSPVTKNDNLLFLNQGKRDKFPRKNVPDTRVDHGTTCILGEHATDRATMPG